MRNNMKTRIFLVAALFAAGLFTANAQQQTQPQQPQQQNANAPRMSPEEMAKKQTERMVTDLKLNDKQKTQVATINTKYAKLRNELMQANQGNREAARPKMKEMETQKNAELKKILTDEQFKLYEDLGKKRQEERRQQMGQPQGQENEKRGGQRGGGQK
jgi:protein CpxP